MRIKVNSLNLGLVYEVCFICSERTCDFMKKAKEVLEQDFVCKTFIYVYDRDPLDKATQNILKRCYSNIFVLDDGVCVAAAEDETHPFRQVYAFVQKNNLHSMGLVSAVDMKYAKFPASIPKDMNSLNWLNQKYFGVDVCSPGVEQEHVALFAEKIVGEIRRRFSHRERKRFVLYPLTDGYAMNYPRFGMISAVAVLTSVITMFMKYLWFGIEFPSNWALNPILELLRIVLLMAAAAVTYVAPGILVTHSLCAMAGRLSVSTTFDAFRMVTTVRIGVIVPILCVIGGVQWINYIERVCGGDGPLGFLLVTAAALPSVFNLILCVCYWVMAIALSYAQGVLAVIRRQKILAVILVPVALAVGGIAVQHFFRLIAS